MILKRVKTKKSTNLNKQTNKQQKKTKKKLINKTSNHFNTQIGSYNRNEKSYNKATYKI